MPHHVEIIHDLLVLRDDAGNRCDYHKLIDLRIAKRQLRCWREDYAFDYVESLCAVSALFAIRAAGTRCVAVDALLEKIAQQTLDIPTLRSRGSDQLDYHDLCVASIHDALRAAYEAGRTAEK